jgi:two-component system, cell cycle response regulator DivK
MPSKFLPEQIARLCDDARRLLNHTAEHGELIEALVISAEQTASTVIAARYYESPTTMGAQLHVLDDCARQNVQAARQLRVSARHQHVAAAELLRDIDGGAPPLMPAPVTVLVVDDQSAVREIVAHALRDAGFVVRTAADGLEAVIAAHAMRPTVIIMDIQMPVLDGLEATRLIKAREATRHARVIAYTGASSLADSARVEFAAVLQKPAPPAEIVATVQQAASVTVGSVQ